MATPRPVGAKETVRSAPLPATVTPATGRTAAFDDATETVRSAAEVSVSARVRTTPGLSGSPIEPATIVSSTVTVGAEPGATAHGSVPPWVLRPGLPISPAVDRRELSVSPTVARDHLVTSLAPRPAVCTQPLAPLVRIVPGKVWSP